MNVVKLFGNQGPSPEQQILQAIGQLRVILNQIRTEMHDRFDRVDKSLNTIYQTMNDRFVLIDVNLGRLQGDVQKIQRALYDVQSDLYRLEHKVFSFLEAGFRRDLNEQMYLAIGYRDTFGEQIPWDRYVTAENKFYTWATQNAKGEISSGSANYRAKIGSFGQQLSEIEMVHSSVEFHPSPPSSDEL